MAKGGKSKRSGKPNYYIFGIAVVAVALAVYVLATWGWASHDPKDLAGKWLFDTSGYNVDSGAGIRSASSTYWEFSPDGTLAIINALTGQQSEGVYQVDGETLTITFDGAPEHFPFVVKGSKLTLGEAGDSVELKRAD
ncbi:MAG: lipocalin family protein [Christensenellales bacterium]|jgi:hypothetical protein